MGYAARASNGESPRELTDRKFKHVAAVTIDRHAGAIGHLVEAINQTNEQARVSREFMADLSVRFDGMDRSIQAVAGRAGDARELAHAIDKVYGAFVSRGFLARMKWLFLGR